MCIIIGLRKPNEVDAAQSGLDNSLPCTIYKEQYVRIVIYKNDKIHTHTHSKIKRGLHIIYFIE